MTGAESFFVRDGGYYRPTESSRGPWSDEQLSGSMIGALLAHGVEDAQPEGFHVVRLTIDMFRAVPCRAVPCRGGRLRCARG